MPHAIYEKTANTFSLSRVHSFLISDLACRSSMLNPNTITAHISILYSQELTLPQVFCRRSLIAYCFQPSALTGLKIFYSTKYYLVSTMACQTPQRGCSQASPGARIKHKNQQCLSCVGDLFRAV